MPSIDLDQDTYDKLAVSARLMDLSPGDVVSLLLRRLVVAENTDRTSRTPTATQQEELMTVSAPTHPGWLPVHKSYLSHPVEGEFNPTTMEVRVSTAPWSGRVFPSPTAAARSVVEHFGGDNRQTTNTNGRKFWRLKDRDQDLRSVVGTRF